MMRLSREKIVHLSHVVTEFMEKDSGIKLKKNRNEIRLLIVKLISEELKKDEKIDRDVRKKIEGMKTSPPEGSPDWDTLYYKMYEEAMGRSQRN